MEKFKFVYDKLTAPQLKNLNSIQSQIYHLLPEDEAMDTLSVKDYLNDLAFKNLSFGNTKNILKSLERKGYVEVAKKENDIFFWQKLPLPLKKKMIYSSGKSFLYLKNNLSFLFSFFIIFLNLFFNMLNFASFLNFM